MLKYRRSKYLALIFIAVVIIPAVILSLLSIRAIGREEAYVEKQFEGTLRAEVAHVSNVVNTAVANMQAELARSLQIPAGEDPSSEFEQWKNASSLVEIPFLLSEDREVLWPIADQRAGAEAQVFAQEQQAFFSGEEKVPVYENIALAYKDEILEEAGDVANHIDEVGALSGAEEPLEIAAKQAYDEETADQAAGDAKALHGERRDKGVEVYSEGGVTEETPVDVMPVVRGGRREHAQAFVGEGKKAAEAVHPSSEDVSAARLADDAERQQVITPEVQADRANEGAVEADRDVAEEATGGDWYRSQTALSQFQQSEPVRDRVYDKAEREGQQLAYRNVQLPKGRGETGKVSPEVEELRSIFIARPLAFEAIVAAGDQGIIPRMINNELRLIYWQKTSTGKIVGCLIDSGEFRDRIVGTLPGIYSPVRILTVLDENSSPLIVPTGEAERDWRRPFVAQEVSEVLPRWEIAAYLTDPDVISSRAQVTTAVMWILIFILFVSIVFGGVLVLRSATAEVKLAQQKTTFVANVSHELKTPLTSIRMFAEMLREGRQPDEEKQKHYLDIMTAETERLTRLINNVLDFSRSEQGKKRYTMKTCNIVALSESVVESQRARLENNCFGVAFQPHEEHLFVHADEEALKQALVNLLSNAEKYSEDRKEIEVSVSRRSDSAVVSVSDRGIGIPPGEAEKIFSEFYRADDRLTSRVKGAGLGLTIARRIVRDHDGDIRCLARDGGGSTFQIILPVIEEQP